MKDNDLDPPFSHVTYRNGQLLRAQDVSDDEEREARLWRLHNRHLHETWGIAVGFETKLLPKAAAVRVGPGYAIDEDGHDLVLDGHVRMPLPFSEHRRRFILTARYRTGVRRPPAEGADGTCFHARRPRPERPLLAWRTVDETQPGQDVLVVAIVALHGGAQGPLDRSVRRQARTLRRPLIVSGSTEPGQSGWRWWKGPSGENLGLALTVSTEEARFTRPAYFAQLQADQHGRTRKATTEQLGFVAKATPSQFVYRLVRGTPLGVAASPEDAEEHGWTVSWTGIERALDFIARTAS